MPVSESTKPRVVSGTRRKVRLYATDRFLPLLEREFGIDTLGWGVCEVGSTFWIHDRNTTPVIALGRSPSVALGHMKGVVHGVYLEGSLIKVGVLLENWRELE